MDHVPFVYHGHDAISLVTAGGAAWSIHTRRDTIDKLHLSGFERAGFVALELIQRLTKKEISSDPAGEEGFAYAEQDPLPRA